MRLLGFATVCLLSAMASISPPLARCGGAPVITSYGLEAGAVSYIWSEGQWMWREHAANPDFVHCGIYGCYQPPVSENLTGFFWSLGMGDPVLGPGDDDGGLPIASWLQVPELIDGYWAGAVIQGNWNVAEDGCLFNQGATASIDATERTVVVLVDQVDGVGYYAVVSGVADGIGNTSFRQPGNAPIVLKPIPTPEPSSISEIAVSSAAPPDNGQIVASLEVALAAPSVTQDALHGETGDILRGYRVYEKRVPTGAKPPQDRSRIGTTSGDPWVLASPAFGEAIGSPPPGGATGGGNLVQLIAADSPATVQVQCDEAHDTYLAYSLVFDSGFETPYLSANSIRLECPCDGVDADGDRVCAPPAGLDCDDSDPSVYPFAPQQCDGQNTNCADPDWPDAPAGERDDDGDGYWECQGDCDDTEPSVYPGGPQLCDGVNNDCLDPTWPATPESERDSDSDGVTICEGDCNDEDSSVYPGAPHLCDGVNNDCDHAEWPNALDEERDSDGDEVAVCEGDCDDGDPSVYPGASQLCDGVNNDCLDSQWPATPNAERDNDGDGVTICAGDCDDASPLVFPGAPEVCDGINNNCSDGRWPQLPPEERDADADGFSICAGDCNDLSQNIHPSAAEIFNGIDDNCNGTADEDVTPAEPEEPESGPGSDDETDSTDPPRTGGLIDLVEPEVDGADGAHWVEICGGVYDVAFNQPTPCILYPFPSSGPGKPPIDPLPACEYEYEFTIPTAGIVPERDGDRILGVELASGERVETATDVTAFDYTGPIAFTRTYRSYMPMNDVLGQRWFHNFQDFLSFGETTGDCVGPDRLNWVQPGVGAVEFYRDGGDWTARNTVYRLWDTGTGYALRVPGGEIREFSSTGELHQIHRAAGTLSVIYSGSRIDAIESNGVARLSFTYSGDSLTRVETAEGDHVDFFYNECGELETVTYPAEDLGFDRNGSPGGAQTPTTHYSYTNDLGGQCEPSGRHLLRIVEHVNHNPLTGESVSSYDTTEYWDPPGYQKDRVSARCFDGEPWCDETTSIRIHYEPDVTRIEDRRNYAYDGTITEEIHEYDGWQLLRVVEDADGSNTRETRFVYDDDGLRVRTLYADGSCVVFPLGVDTLVRGVSVVR